MRHPRRRDGKWGRIPLDNRVSASGTRALIDHHSLLTVAVGPRAVSMGKLEFLYPSRAREDPQNASFSFLRVLLVPAKPLLSHHFLSSFMTNSFTQATNQSRYHDRIML